MATLPSSVDRYPTPLRYPGGKQRLGGFFEQVLRWNDLVGGRYVEPFAGGAGAAMYLLQRGLVSEVVLNDIDRSVYAFWVAVKQHNDRLCEMIDEAPVTLTEWDRQKEVQRKKATAPLLALGFSTLFLNRTNRSGILRAGVIGGRKQDGLWRLDARFNKETLIRRIKALKAHARNIRLSCADAEVFLRRMRSTPSSTTFVYLDPPYFVKGQDLYLNRYRTKDHQALASCVATRLKCPWVITYDDVDDVRTLYQGYRKRSYCLSHTADERHEGKELMIISPGLRAPRLP